MELVRYVRHNLLDVAHVLMDLQRLKVSALLAMQLDSIIVVLQLPLHVLHAQAIAKLVQLQGVQHVMPMLLILLQPQLYRAHFAMLMQQDVLIHLMSQDVKLGMYQGLLKFVELVKMLNAKHVLPMILAQLVMTDILFKAEPA